MKLEDDDAESVFHFFNSFYLPVPVFCSAYCIPHTNGPDGKL